MPHTPDPSLSKKENKQAHKTAKRERKLARKSAKRERRRATGNLTAKDALQQLLGPLLDQFDAAGIRAEDIFGQIAPLAEMFINFALDPASFLQSAQGQALLAPGQEAISANFEGARQNLFNTLGQTGFSPQSGVGAAPLANLFGQEATAQGQNVQNLIGQALGLGTQGAGLLAQQQQFFDPLRFAGGISQAAGTRFSAPPPLGQQIGLAALGAGGTALGGLAGNPRLF